MGKKVKLDITLLCNYNGQCLITKDNCDKGPRWCYGARFGTCECPLSIDMVEIEIKKNRVDSFNELWDIEINNKEII